MREHGGRPKHRQLQRKERTVLSREQWAGSRWLSVEGGREKGGRLGSCPESAPEGGRTRAVSGVTSARALAARPAEAEGGDGRVSVGECCGDVHAMPDRARSMR